MNPRPGTVALLASVLCLALALPAMAAGEPAPVCAPAAAAAPAAPDPAGFAASPPAAPATAVPDLFGGSTPPAQPRVCVPPAGCCAVFVPGHPCPMCDGYDC